MIDYRQGDVLDQLAQLKSEGVKVRTCVTSPPYWGLRDYGAFGQIGLEKTPDEYVAKMVQVFRAVRDVLADDGTLWLNLGDSYANQGAKDNSKVGGFTGERIRKGVKGIMDSRPREIPEGLKQKDLVGIPWRVAFALQADGWYLRSDIIWHKPNPMPESVRDRPTKAHEYIFLLSKSPKYFYDADAVREANTGKVGNARSFRGGGAYTQGRSFNNNAKVERETHGNDFVLNGRNRRSVWTCATKPYKGAHFATFPPALIEPCILAGSARGDIVLDPFGGSGTTAEVALKHGRRAILIELNPQYVELQRARLAKYETAQTAPLFEV